jgi:hypothetical protein
MRWIFIIIIVLAFPAVYGEISLSNLKEEYNIGESIAPTVSIILDRDFNGFQKAEIDCKSYSLMYYAVPKTIRKEGVFTEDLVSLPAFAEIKGKCRIIVSLENKDGTIFESMTSKEFRITDGLVLDLKQSKTFLEPGETLNLKGNLYNVRGEPVSGMLRLALDNRNHNFNIQDGAFSFDIVLPADIKAGKRDIPLTFQDNSGNFAERSISLTVPQVPRKIAIALDNTEYLPYE